MRKPFGFLAIIAAMLALPLSAQPTKPLTSAQPLSPSEAVQGSAPLLPVKHAASS